MRVKPQEFKENNELKQEKKQALNDIKAQEQQVSEPMPKPTHTQPQPNRQVQEQGKEVDKAFADAIDKQNRIIENQEKEIQEANKKADWFDRVVQKREEAIEQLAGQLTDVYIAYMKAETEQQKQQILNQHIKKEEQKKVIKFFEEITEELKEEHDDFLENFDKYELEIAKKITSKLQQQKDALKFALMSAAGPAGSIVAFLDEEFGLLEKPLEKLNEAIDKKLNWKEKDLEKELEEAKKDEENKEQEQEQEQEQNINIENKIEQPEPEIKVENNLPEPELSLNDKIFQNIYDILEKIYEENNQSAWKRFFNSLFRKTFPGKILEIIGIQAGRLQDIEKYVEEQNKMDEEALKKAEEQKRLLKEQQAEQQVERNKQEILQDKQMKIMEDTENTLKQIQEEGIKADVNVNQEKESESLIDKLFGGILGKFFKGTKFGKWISKIFGSFFNETLVGRFLKKVGGYYAQGIKTIIGGVNKLIPQFVKDSFTQVVSASKGWLSKVIGLGENKGGGLLGLLGKGKNFLAPYLGKAGGFLGKALGMGSKALKFLGPVGMVLSTGLSALNGYQNAAQWFGKDEKDLTFSEKASSVVGGIVEGLTFGLLDGKFIAHLTNGIINIVTGIFGAIKDGILGIVKWIWDRVSGFVVKIAKLAWSLIEKPVKWIFGILKDIGKALWDTITAPFRFVWDIIKKVADFFGNIFGSLFDGVKNAFNSYIENLKKVWGAIFGWIGKLFSWIWDKVKKGFEAYINFWKSIFGWINKNIIQPIANFINKHFIEPIKNFFNKVGEIFDKIKEGLGKSLSILWDKFTKPFKKFFGWIYNTFIKPIKDFIDSIAEALNSVIEKIKKFLGPIIEKISAVIEWIKKKKEAVKETINKVKNKVVNTAKNIKDKVLSFFGFGDDEEKQKDKTQTQQKQTQTPTPTTPKPQKEQPKKVETKAPKQEVKKVKEKADEKKKKDDIKQKIDSIKKLSKILALDIIEYKRKAKQVIEEEKDAPVDMRGMASAPLAGEIRDEINNVDALIATYSKDKRLQPYVKILEKERNELEQIRKAVLSASASPDYAQKELSAVQPFNPLTALKQADQQVLPKITSENATDKMQGKAQALKTKKLSQPQQPIVNVESKPQVIVPQENKTIIYSKDPDGIHDRGLLVQGDV